MDLDMPAKRAIHKQHLPPIGLMVRKSKKLCCFAKSVLRPGGWVGVGLKITPVIRLLSVVNRISMNM